MLAIQRHCWRQAPTPGTRFEGTRMVASANLATVTATTLATAACQGLEAACYSSVAILVP